MRRDRNLQFYDKRKGMPSPPYEYPLQPSPLKVTVKGCSAAIAMIYTFPPDSLPERTIAVQEAPTDVASSGEIEDALDSLYGTCSAGVVALPGWMPVGTCMVIIEVFHTACKSTSLILTTLFNRSYQEHWRLLVGQGFKDGQALWREQAITTA